MAAAKKDLLSSFLGSLQLQPKLFLWSPPSAEDHDVLVPPSHYPVKATSHNKPTTSHKAAGHAHTFTIEVARDTALCSGIAFILFCQMFIDFPFKHQILISARLIWVDKFLFCLHDLNKVAFLCSMLYGVWCVCVHVCPTPRGDSLESYDEAVWWLSNAEEEVLSHRCFGNFASVEDDVELPYHHQQLVHTSQYIFEINFSEYMNI